MLPRLPTKRLAHQRYTGSIKFCVSIFQNFSVTFFPALRSCLRNLKFNTFEGVIKNEFFELVHWTRVFRIWRIPKHLAMGTTLQKMYRKVRNHKSNQAFWTGIFIKDYPRKHMPHFTFIILDTQQNDSIL